MKRRHITLIWVMTVIDLILWYTFMVWENGSVTIKESYDSNYKFLIDMRYR